MIEEKLNELTINSLRDRQFENCYIYDIKVANNKINVFLESDEAITYEICRKVSRDLEAYLDEIVWMDGKYTLEVSSPGVGSPLKFARQYPKNIGRTIEVKQVSGEIVKGLLVSANEENIEVSYKERIKEGKKKRTVEHVEQILIADIAEAKIKVTF